MTTSQVLPPRATHFSIVFFPGNLLLNLLFMQPCYPHEPLSAIYQSILQHLATDFPGRQHDKKMLKAAISLAFHGLLRASEFTSPTTVSYNPKKTLLKSDVTIHHHTIRLQIKASKTDQRGHRQTILLGCTNSSTCPISLIEQYLEASHHPSPHLPLFHFADGKLLT